MGQKGSHSLATNPQTLNNVANISTTLTTLPAELGAAIPAHVIIHDKNAVGIGGQKLAEILEVYYKAGVRRVEAAALVAGQPLVVDGRIYIRRDWRGSYTYYWLYPLQPEQNLLRDLCFKYRGNAVPNAKRPTPITVLAVMPRSK